MERHEVKNTYMESVNIAERKFRDEKTDWQGNSEGIWSTASFFFVCLFFPHRTLWELKYEYMFD